ncbi:unnamed protein product, partial [Heterosigma akashiwo]
SGRRFYAAEVRAEDGRETNTRLLREQGAGPGGPWRGLLMDAGHEDAGISLFRHVVTPGNILGLLARHAVPREPGVLSIDLDFADFWVWAAIDPGYYRPRVVVSEHNALPCARGTPVSPAAMAPRSPGRRAEEEEEGREAAWARARWDGRTRHHGASLGALARLAAAKGYAAAHCEAHGVNCFFVRRDLL